METSTAKRGIGGKANARGSGGACVRRRARHTHGVSALSQRGVAPSRATAGARAARGGRDRPDRVVQPCSRATTRSARDASTRIVSNPAMSAADWRARWTTCGARSCSTRAPTGASSRRSICSCATGAARCGVADDVLRREPDNLAAWWVVLRAARDVDPARWREAAAADPAPQPARRASALTRRHGQPQMRRRAGARPSHRAGSGRARPRAGGAADRAQPPRRAASSA